MRIISLLHNMLVSVLLLHVFAVQVADSAKAVAEQCDITVAMLADPEAAEIVATGPDGVAAGMSSGKPCLHSLVMPLTAYWPWSYQLTMLMT